MSRIAIIAPAPIKGSGGVARIYKFAHALVERGDECNIFVFDAGSLDAQTLKCAAENFYESVGFTIFTDLNHLPQKNDLVIATRWDTAKISLKVDARRRGYLIQDFEVVFNPMGDGSLLAENSYMLGLQPLTYGRWLASKLAFEFGNQPVNFEFASDTTKFRCHTPMTGRLQQRPSLAFVYQADKTRRCPVLGIEALGIVKHHRPDTDLLFVGSNSAPHLWYEFTNVGNLSIDDLNTLYNRCHLGLSLSSSNPSCNAFDMMAAGLPSVDLYRENNLYDIPPQAVLLAHQTPESIAEAVIHLLDHPAELVQRSVAGIKFMKSRSQKRETETFIAAIDDILAGSRRAGGRTSPYKILYDQPPVIAPINRNPFVDAYFHRQRLSSGSQNSLISLVRSVVERLTFQKGRKIYSGLYYPTNTNKGDVSSVVPTMPTREERKYLLLVKRLLGKFGGDTRLDAIFFDAGHYLSTYPDVAASKVDPLRHFIRHGIKEGRTPSPFFDTNWYESVHPRQERGELSAIGHYIAIGSKLNQSPNAKFDSIWYLSRNPDVKRADFHPLLHYILHGESERRDPSSGFSTGYYLDSNPDVVASGMSPLRHFLDHGKNEGRKPRPETITRLPTARSQADCLGEEIATDVFSWVAAPSDLEPDAPRVLKQILAADQLDNQTSFDVWNTILHRRCHPDEIKLRSARYLLLNAWQEIRPGLRSATRLMISRMRAENASAPLGDYEYRFVDAIEGWFAEVLVPASDAMRRAALAKAIIAHEMDAEAGSVEVDENLALTIPSLRRAPIFISDFYMESSFLEGLLARAGLGRRFVRGYASCDVFKNKRSGDLFRFALDDMQIGAQDLTHIGDNPLADVERATAAGIKAVPYVSQIDEERNEWYATSFRQLNDGKFVDHNRRMLALAATIADTEAPTFKFGEPEDSALFKAGCRIGLLTFGYCLNVMQDAIIRKAPQVVFFAREGIVLKKIYDLIASHNPFDVTPPPSSLIYVSRRATFAASLAGFTNEDFMRLWTMYWQQSPVAFARSLNLDTTAAAAAARRVGIDPDAIVSAPWSDAAFQAFLNNPEFRGYAIEDISRQKSLLCRYLQQEIPDPQDEYLVVDIGWRGTIQDNVARVLNKPVRGHYLALRSYLNQQVSGSTKVAWLSDGNVGGAYDLPDQPAPIEMVFNGFGGSTIGYEERDGRIEPIREVFDSEEATVVALASCRAGMEAVVPSLSRYVRLHGLEAANLLDLNRRVVSDLLTSPPTALADVFGRLAHNETFGVGAVEAMDETGFASVAATPPGADLHAALHKWLGFRWPDGMSRQSVVAEWWRDAAPPALASAPLMISRAQSTVLLRGTGTRLAVYASASAATPDRLATIANAMRALTGVGFNVELYIDDLDACSDLLDRYLGNALVSVLSGWLTQRRPTFALATDVTSAAYVARVLSADYKGYLVQDSEWAPNLESDDALETESSFAYGLHHFTIGRWLSHLLRSKFGALAYPCGIGVDTDIHTLKSDLSRERAICIPLQSDMSRRANSIALRAAEIIKRRLPATDIYVYGSQHAPDLGFEFQHLGPIEDPAQLNALFNRCRVGLCVSLSNPSRTAFEMAAAGCRPVDLYRYNNLMDHIGDVSTLTFQTADSVAAGLLACFDQAPDPRALAARVENRTLEWERASLAANVLAVIERRSMGDWPLSPSFEGDAVLASTDDSPAVRAFCERQWESAIAVDRSFSSGT